MGHRLVQRRLSQVSARIRELTEELRVVEDQMSHIVEDADEKSLRALVSETPSAAFEYREAKKHADVIQRHFREIHAELADLERRMNSLLDRMKESNV
ncbi:MAG: hypothetical protein WCP83_02390 [Actinomycetota bacterium]